MTGSYRLIALALAIALEGCYPPPLEGIGGEVPKGLVIKNAASRVDLRFANRTARLMPADVLRLRRLAARGDIAPSDRVTLVLSGGPPLAAARLKTIADEL